MKDQTVSAATQLCSTNGTAATARSKDEEYRSLLSSSLAETETRVVKILRVAVFGMLVATAALVCAGVYIHTVNEERDNFVVSFENHALQIMDSFTRKFERNIGAVASLSTSLTAYALNENATFPFVTVPYFELLGSHARVLSGSHIVHYGPLVRDDQREEWEAWAMEHRSQINSAYERDLMHRERQDAKFQQEQPSTTPPDEGGGKHSRRIEQDNEDSTKPSTIQSANTTLTILEDGSNYHPHIWTAFSRPPADEPVGNGPYVPSWQRSAIDEGKQFLLNYNWANSDAVRPDSVATIIQERKAVLNRAIYPLPEMKPKQMANLKVSQYRNMDIEDLVDGLSTFLSYPVFDSFDEDIRQVAGVLSTNIYWKILFSDIVRAGHRGIICVVEDYSHQESFTYRLDGPEATFLGMGDLHDVHFDDLEISEDILDYLKRRAGSRNRAYLTVPVSENGAGYRISVYPSRDLQATFTSDKPIMYSLVLMAFFLFSAGLFLVFSYFVERRQYIMTQRVMDNAYRATEAERELNEFLSHEVRNPLSAAISAATFISTAVNESSSSQAVFRDPETENLVKEDIEVVLASLHFINNFVRSILDVYRTNNKKMKIEMAPTDIRRDVFDHVAAILYKRVANFDVIIECPANLIVMSDCVRLKQVIMNLACNSAKFVEKGFVRMRAAIDDNNQVRLLIEDSGPGIKPENREHIFSKYQMSLLQQGTGIGLNLSKKLTTIMNGDLWLDDSYDSGVEDCPGARFVVQLNTSPLDMEDTLPPMERRGLEPGHTASAVSRSNPNAKLEGLIQTIIEPLERRPQVDRQLSAQVQTKFEEQPPEQSPFQSFSIRVDSSEQQSSPAAEVGAGVSADTNVSPTHPTPSSVPPDRPLPELHKLPEGLDVLFVDDDTVLRKLFVRAVRKVAPSWNVSEAGSGEAALHICGCDSDGESNPPMFDLIFMDQYMTGVDKQLLGTETIQAMRSRGITCKLVGLSANDLHDAFTRAGADEFILKPMPCKVFDLQRMLWHILCNDKNGRREDATSTETSSSTS